MLAKEEINGYRWTTYSEQSWKRLLGDVSCATWVEFRPGLLESADLIPADSCHAAAALIDVRKTFEDKRHEKRNEDVHADYVPGDEQGPRPSRVSTVALEEAVLVDAVRWNNSCKVFHYRIPSFTTTHPEEQDKRFGNIAEVEIDIFVRAKSRQSKGLSERNGVHEEKNEPGRQQVTNRSQGRCSCLEKLIKLIVPWNQKKGDGDQEELMELVEG